MSIIKKTLIILLSITIIGFIALIIYSNNRTYLNDINHEGNSIGNIYNGGLVCEIDNKIYFSNISDDNKLYLMTSDLSNIRKISDDKVAYINADKDYIYYTRVSNNKVQAHPFVLPFNNCGIYRINLNGKDIKLMSSKPGAYLSLRGNHIFYQSYDVNDGIFFNKNKIDGKDEILLVKDAIIPAQISQDNLYYTGSHDNKDINNINLKSYVVKKHYIGNFMQPIIINDYIYYISPRDNYTIWRSSIFSDDNIKIVNNRCSTFNISNDGKSLYYQTDDNKDNSFNHLNLNTLESTNILDGNYKQISITNNYVFFNSFDNSATYVINTKHSNVISPTIFSPPNLSLKPEKLNEDN